MNTEKLYKVITNALEEIFAKSKDPLGYEIKTLPHNGAEVQLVYIFKDATSESGYNFAPCADPVKVYGIAGEKNIKKKLRQSLVCD